MGPIRFTSLNAAAATGAGIANEMFGPRNIHTMQVIVTGAPSAAVVNLEGSADGGTTWGKLATFDLTAGNISGDFVTASDASVNRIRANLSTLTGGTSPTVTAIINSECN